MTKFKLLKDLQQWLEEKTAGFRYEVDLQRDDGDRETRAPEVHRMRLPRSDHYKKYAPYIILKLTTWHTRQAEGQRTEQVATVRMIFCVPNENEEQGELDLLNLMEFVERELLRDTYNGRSFSLDLETGPEGLIYSDDTRPFYAGEMAVPFIVKETERDVRRLLAEM